MNGGGGLRDGKNAQISPDRNYFLAVGKFSVLCNIFLLNSKGYFCCPFALPRPLDSGYATAYNYKMSVRQEQSWFLDKTRFICAMNWDSHELKDIMSSQQHTMITHLWTVSHSGVRFCYGSNWPLSSIVYF